MSRDKQIEEMAKSVCRTPNCKMIVCADFKEQNELPCDKRCRAYIYAKRFYDKGYRKTADVAEEIFAEIDAIFRKHFQENKTKSVWEPDLLKEVKQVSRGTINNLWSELSELKKKYTENL